jgi:hypothetical protein
MDEKRAGSEANTRCTGTLHRGRRFCRRKRGNGAGKANQPANQNDQPTLGVEPVPSKRTLADWGRQTEEAIECQGSRRGNPD